MCDVYANASITVSADSAGSVWDGFLHEQEYAHPLAEHDVKRKVAGVDVTFRKPLAHPDFASQMTGRYLPNYHRVWTLQEQQLSRRILHYTKSEMVWECFEQRYCECRRDSGPSQRQLGSLQIETSVEVYRQWSLVIREYTNCALTYEGDKLPAISGLATRFQAIITKISGGTDEYLAGLWKGNLASDLCWLPSDSADREAWLRNNLGPKPVLQVPELAEADVLTEYNAEINKGEVNSDQRRPSTYVAPSWSWASLNGPVSYFGALGWSAFHSAIRVVDASTTTNNRGDAFGPVTNVSITLDGLVVRDLVLQQSSLIMAAENSMQDMMHRFLLMDSRDQHVIDIVPDDPTELMPHKSAINSKARREIVCMFVGYHEARVQRDQHIK